MAETPRNKTTAIKALETTKKVRPMIKEWNKKALEAKANGAPVAYYFINSYCEDIMQAMGIISVGTENYAGVCAAKMDAERFIGKAQAEGYASHLCSYVTCWVGFDALYRELGEMPPDAPDGGLPRPDLMIGTGMMICDPRTKGYQASRRFTDAPMHVFCLPWPPADADLEEVQDYYITYIIEELRGLVDFLERTTGRKMDWNKLSEITDLVERTEKLWFDAYMLRKAIPAPMPTEDAMTTMVPGYFYMGTQQAYDFYQDLYNEVKHKVDNGIGVIPDEKYRLLWGGGLPPWFALKLFNYFESLGAVFPTETIYHPPPPVEIPAGVTDPLERIALRFFDNFTHRYGKAQQHTGNPDVEWILEMIDDYKIDGVVFHRAMTCRTVHCGQIHQINVLKEHLDIPTLILEGDIVDIRYYNEAETYQKIEAFIETLDTCKMDKR
ncbi:MAG: 2-hydroxyacyl-CoA dehydratase family protein [Chloroflexota bacterium]|nr:2-hydroxyacyl-CoA dehydratase family protein [Chloroflexota bacterium]